MMIPDYWVLIVVTLHL